MIDWKGKKVAVLGFGIEGISSALFLREKGAEVTLLDKNQELRIKNRESGIRNQELKGLDLVAGENYLSNLDRFEIIVRSPGIKRDLPELIEAEKKGVIITSQTKLFFDLCSCPIIGVTGTKGKGTTSSLIYEMLKTQGFDAYLGGNIGKPPLDFLNKLTPQSWVVLELSSFQLFDFTKSPHIAVVLMVTSEHLDYHKDTQEYVDAKRNILRFQKPSGFAIINRDYPASHESDIHTGARVFQVSRERESEEGCFVKEGKIILRILGKLRGSADQNDQIAQKIRNSDDLNYPTHRLSESSEFSEIEIIKTKDILLPGKHNWENVCSAVLAAFVTGVSDENIVRVLKAFKGLEHRLELVGEVNGVKYYDDSFSTTPETAIAAIQAFKEPEILILGGSGKNSNFTELGEVIGKAENIKAIIGIGVEWERIKSQITNHKSQITIIEGLKEIHEIVQKASEIAKPGDVVLLSPACASFGMFRNYKDRGEQFKREVKDLR